MLGSGHFINSPIRSILDKNEESRHPSALLPLTSYILHPEGHPSSSPPVVPPPWLPPWPAPPSVMSSSPDAAAAACGSTFCQLTSSENWRLRSAMPLCLQRTWRLRCNPVGSVRWQRSASRRLPRLESPAHRGTAIMQGARPSPSICRRSPRRAIALREP